MELVFKEELEELLDTLKELEDYIKRILDEIEYEIEDEESCYGYEYDDEYEEIKNSVFMRFKDEFEFYKLELNNDIDSFIKNVPGVFRDNLFAIGKVRREEILTLLSKAKNLIYDLELDDTISIGKIKNEISDYLSKIFLFTRNVLLTISDSGRLILIPLSSTTSITCVTPLSYPSL